MRKLYAVSIAGVVALLGLTWLKNTYSYGLKSIKWRMGKTVIDASLIILAALYFPALLVSWIVMWLSAPIQRRGIQVTLAVLLGIAFSSIGGVALEVLCVLAIFAVDLLTGNRGFYGWYKQPIPDNFIPSLNRRHTSV